MPAKLGKLVDFVNCTVDEAVSIAQKVGYHCVEVVQAGPLSHELVRMVEEAKNHGVLTFSDPIDITREPWFRPFSLEKLPA